MRIRLTAVIAIAVALAVTAASPASAATVSRARLDGSLLTAGSLGAGWHRFQDSSSGAPTVTGCAAFDHTPAVATRDADQDFQYAKLPLFVTESIAAFGTATQAEADFTQSVRLFTRCARFTVDGRVWKVVRLATPAYADQQAMFRITGSLPSATGAVQLAIYVVVTRHGRQQVAVLLTVAGNDFTAAMRRQFASSSVRLSRMATAKVARTLGR